MDPCAVLKKYFLNDAFAILVSHSSMVAGLAVEIGRNIGLSGDSIQFLWEAGMLHDIGVCGVNAPEMGLYADNPYLAHGILGRTILEKEGLPLHALVCERHIGVGLTAKDIISQELPLPPRDMVPGTVSEEIICFADLFFSKSAGSITRRKSIEDVRGKLAGFGCEKVQIFENWFDRFGGVL